MRVAMFYYGLAELWWVIYEYNKEVIGDDPFAVPAGITLKVPLLTTEDLPYVVQRDCEDLFLVALEHYGVPSAYYVMLEANGLTDPPGIVAGQVITLFSLISNMRKYSIAVERHVKGVYPSWFSIPSV
ncbi:hypothetical protein GH141_01515 [bacterium]|nr:hypothetical protein [bacterium]